MDLPTEHTILQFRALPVDPERAVVSAFTD